MIKIEEITLAYVGYRYEKYEELSKYYHIFITNTGLLINKKTNKPLKTHYDKYGYEKVTIGKKTYLVHRLVALTFVTNPRERQYKIVCHKNGNRADNRAINLMWTNNNFINIRRKNFDKPNRGRKIVAFRYGIQIDVYDNAGKAEKALGANRSEIYRCCKGERNTANGFSFMYYEDWLNQGQYILDIVTIEERYLPKER